MMYVRSVRVLAQTFNLCVFALVSAIVSASGQEPANQDGVIARKDVHINSRIPQPLDTEGSATVSRYLDPLQGVSSDELIRRALAANADLIATRLDIERARARLRQAGLRPNPSIDFEQTTGRFTGSAGERETSIGFALPLELGGKRQRRIDLARAELNAAEAEIADRERRLAAEVRTAYAEAMAALRELEITENLNSIDTQTARIIEARVTEGESAPLEFNLLRVEVERLKARRALVEGRLEAAMLRLKNLTGMPADASLQLREDLVSPALPDPPASLEAALDIALRSRPDLRLARLIEEAAQAGLRLAQAQATPDLIAFSRYTQSRSLFDNTPVGVLRDKDNLLSFGISISIPLFNKNQGAKAEAEAAILQARRRREFTEAMVRSEVASAYARYQAAQVAIDTLREGVLAKSQQNIKAVRGAYEVGAFRITDLLVEQRRFIDSQREFIEAMAERYRALADLQAAIGAPVE